MKIAKIEFDNFKPYYDKVAFDLSVNPEQNIVLIGGRNGQGKTSFLLGAVWCLYGNNIDKVDEVFKKEIKGNYSKFLNNSLNWQAHSEGLSTFSVRMVFTDVELSEGLKQEQLPAEVELVRTYNVDSSVDGETFEIYIDGQKNGLIGDDTDKVNFVNDYLIPLEIAKFVFFDAEKIADLATLGAKDQALVINQAFNQILGLSTYENLVDDLENVEKDLSKKEAKGELMMSITSFESQINNNEARIKSNELELQEIDDDLLEKDRQLREVIDSLYKRGDTSLKTNLEELKKRKEKLAEHLETVKVKFHEAAEIIPFAIMAPLLQEANDQISRELEIDKKSYQDDDLKEKTKELAERLFNKPPFPEHDLDMEVKLFYYQKAKGILASIIQDEQEEVESFLFTHTLGKADGAHIADVLGITNTYSKGTFENIFGDYMRIYNEFQEASSALKKIETANQDEFIGDLQNQKAIIERERSVLDQRKGVLENEIIRLVSEIKHLKEKLEFQLGKVKLSNDTEKQKKVLKNYINTLNEFIQLQKSQKKASLQSSLLTELSRLINKPNLVKEVEINIIHGLGLEVKLYNRDKKETNPSTDFSKGEQQLYISALLKAILAESIYELPVFIDTPLGRLDQEHRDNILANYYPELSAQVIILSTNTEIRATDLPKIQNHIARTYKLDNTDNKTQAFPSYFATT